MHLLRNSAGRMHGVSRNHAFWFRTIINSEISHAPWRNPGAGPDGPVLLIVVVGIVLFVGYKIYCAVFKQMAINAKNKRIIKNEVTQWTDHEYGRSKRR